MPDSAPMPALSPSDVVFLARDRFAAPGGRLNYYKSAGIEIKVSVPELAQQAYAAAFLAAEQAGLLSLNLRSKKAMLGLRTVEAIYANPAGGQSLFGAEALESRVQQNALSLSGKKQHEVWRVVHSLWSSDSANPSGDALGQIQNGLAARGILESTSTKRLKVFTVVEHSEPEAVLALAAERAGEVEALLEHCRTARPDIWKRLIDDVAKGIRKHEDSGPDIDD